MTRCVSTRQWDRPSRRHFCRIRRLTPIGMLGGYAAVTAILFHISLVLLSEACVGFPDLSLLPQP
jgi:hypothetical protein